MAAIGPMFGQLGFFHKFAGAALRTSGRWNATGSQTQRLLGVLETRLAGRDWLMGDDYTIADVATVGLGAKSHRLLRRTQIGRNAIH